MILTKYKLTSAGVQHLLIPIIAVIILVGAAGTYFLMKSHAATPCVDQQFGYGSSGQCVSDLQTMANQVYYHGGSYGNKMWHISTDGAYGPQTQNDIIQFQKDVSITHDGIVGHDTWHNLCTLGDGDRYDNNTNAGYRNAGCASKGW